MFDIQEELKKLPDNPGVYIMKDEKKNIIYVGKAIVLKNRVRQYFQASANHSPKVAAMVSKITEFEYIVTHSELEALILECNLIKKHKPRYNILLKDDKNYPYIKVTMHEEYPRILMTRRIEKDGARYYGPYSSAGAVKETIELLKKLFPVKSCKKILPRDIGKERPCLNFYIHQCLGPCQGGVNKEEYSRLMKDICLFLGGKQEEIINRLEKEMKAASENMEFEKAAGLRDKINSLRHIAEKQRVLSTTMEDQDVIAFAKDQPDSCIQVFFIRGGKLIGREHFIFEGEGETEDRELLASFTKQFYATAPAVPPSIVLQEEIEEHQLIEEWLSEKRGTRVHIKVPQKGDKQRLVEMVAQNALIALQQFKDRIRREGILSSEGLEGIAGVLDLESLPQRIEAYDISNTGTSEMVASMVVFEKGLPAKKEYRKFKIKSVTQQDDYASMQEVLYRRFRHGVREQEESRTDDKFSTLPDLILVDGGLGHVKAAEAVLRELNIPIPVFGMVKDDRHRTRGLVGSARGNLSQAREVDLAKNMPVLRFVTAIQDEAHRFAVEYNRKLREKRYSRSALDDIEGIGPKRKKALIKHFGSLNRIKGAELEELLKVEGINRQAALKIFEYFRQ